MFPIFGIFVQPIQARRHGARKHGARNEDHEHALTIEHEHDHDHEHEHEHDLHDHGKSQVCSVGKRRRTCLPGGGQSPSPTGESSFHYMAVHDDNYDHDRRRGDKDNRTTSHELQES